MFNITRRLQAQFNPVCDILYSILLKLQKTKIGLSLLSLINDIGRRPNRDSPMNNKIHVKIRLGLVG